MRYLALSLFIFFSYSCAQSPSESTKAIKYHYEQEKVERLDKANLHFVRPFNISLLWHGYTAYVGVGNQNVGGLGFNETAKIYIDEGVYKITAASNVDALTKLLTSDQTFTTRFEKGKNYYFIIEASITKTFVPKPITRTKYLKLTEKSDIKEKFTKTLNTTGQILRNMQKF